MYLYVAIFKFKDTFQINQFFACSTGPVEELQMEVSSLPVFNADV